MITNILGRLAEIQTGPFGSQLHKEDYVTNGTPIVTVEHLGKRIFTEQNLPTVSDRDKIRLSKYLLAEGDIVFSCVGAVDRCSFVDSAHAGWLFSGRCLRVRAIATVYPLYLYYYFCLDSTKNFVRNIAVGATMPSINTKLMSEIPVVLPSMENQKRIAHVLLAIDKKIECNERKNDNLQQIAYAVFSRYYSCASKFVPLLSLVEILGGGTPKTGNPAFWNGRIPFFTPKDVGNPYTFNTEKYISEEGLDHCNSRLYPIDTVFVTARGTVGKVALAGIPMAMNQSCYALVGKGIEACLVYFYVLKVVQDLKHKASGAVFDAIVTRDFESENVFRLSDEDSLAFCDLARPLFEAIRRNSIENLRLSALREAILPRLMSGELDVSGLSF